MKEFRLPPQLWTKTWIRNALPRNCVQLHINLIPSSIGEHAKRAVGSSGLPNGGGKIDFVEKGKHKEFSKNRNEFVADKQTDAEENGFSSKVRLGWFNFFASCFPLNIWLGRNTKVVSCESKIDYIVKIDVNQLNANLFTIANLKRFFFPNEWKQF